MELSKGCGDPCPPPQRVLRSRHSAANEHSTHTIAGRAAGSSARPHGMILLANPGALDEERLSRYPPFARAGYVRRRTSVRIV